MPNTGSPWFIPYVENTDLVRDWPADSLELANAIVAALEDIPVTQKKIAAFTGSGTWTVPAGVTYAIAHMMGGGGGAGRSNNSTNGANSSVAFAGGTVIGPGLARSTLRTEMSIGTVGIAGVANTGQSGYFLGASGAGESGSSGAAPGQFTVAGGAVTPAASITVTVGAGGAAGTDGAAGGSGYVYIEYYEEV